MGGCVATMTKTQRVRCPIHNLIEFGNTPDTAQRQLEKVLWEVVQTRPFQRLRRIRQLGFSELVFPGATHTRFAHSLGVFHTARLLMRIIERHIASSGGIFRAHQAHVALAAALLHDVGHGMFSHALEPIGKALKLPLARHETVSAMLIGDGEIAKLLNDELGSGFANDVAMLVGRDGPSNLYDAVVSSQFDADRLDYMQRDRLMTGVQSSGVDPQWLMANLEVATVPLGADDQGRGTIETLVLGSKAAQTAESYVLGLFHLYPNVYLHKTTRGAEMLFGGLMRRLYRLAQEGRLEISGLPANYPLRRFIEEPEKLDRLLSTDDTGLWGALPMLADAEDAEVARFARHLWERKLVRCFDIRLAAEAAIPRRSGEERASHLARLDLACTQVEAALREQAERTPSAPERIFRDAYTRPPYKGYQESRSPLSRILIRSASGQPQDVAEISPVIAGAEPFRISRAYVFRDDSEAASTIENEMRTSFERARNVQT